MRLNRRIVTPIVVLAAVATACFLLTAAVGVWAAYDPLAAWWRFGLIASGPVIAALIAWSGRKHAKTTLSWVALVCAVAAAGLSLAFVLGWIANSGLVASAMLVLLPLGAGGVRWHWYQHKVAPALLGAVGLVLGLGGLAATLERSSWLSLVVGLLISGLVYLWFNPRLPRLLRWLCAGFAVVGLGFGLGLYSWVLLDPALDPWLARAPVLGNLVERMPLWRDSLGLIGDYRFTGSGLAATALVYSTYVYLLHAPYFYHAHNLYLQIAIEQGLPGLFTFASLWLAILVSLLKTYPRAGLYSGFFCLATLCSVAALTVYGLFDSELFATWLVPLLFIPGGFAFALYWSVKQRQPASRDSEHNRRAPRFSRGAMVMLPVLPILLLVLSPEAMIHMYANLGTVAQTKAELSSYAGAQWPIQDELRRTPQVDLSVALHYYHSVVALEPDNITAQERIGQIALSQGDYQLARKHLSLAYAIAPERNAVRLLLGEVSAITGSPDQAVALWQDIAVGKEQTLDERLWWYTSRNADQEAARVGVAVARAKAQADYSAR